MASAFSSWDYLSVVAEQVLAALQTDSVLGDGGSLEITTWEAELRESPNEYNDNELDAIAVEATRTSAFNTLSDWEQVGFQVRIVVYVAGGVLRTVMQKAKRIEARLEHIIKQQNRSTKQFSNLIAELEGAQAGSFRLGPLPRPNFGDFFGDAGLRGIAVLDVPFTVDFVPVID